MCRSMQAGPCWLSGSDELQYQISACGKTWVKVLNVQLWLWTDVLQLVYSLLRTFASCVQVRGGSCSYSGGTLGTAEPVIPTAC